jgi:hypothetical protein
MSHWQRILVMPPSLRLVKPAARESLPTSLTYIVSRTRCVEPGTPYVMAALVDRALAEDYRYAEAEVYSLAEMRTDPRLAEALAAWEAGDVAAFHLDRAAHERIEASYRASILRAAARHPSVLGRG